MITPPEGIPVAETTIGVRMSELDSFGHVNHAVFLNYFEHARFEALERAGFAWSVLGAKCTRSIRMAITLDCWHAMAACC